MNAILFFDTETTGLPQFGEPSDSPEQPHLTQIAAVLAHAETREELASIDLTIKAEAWEVPEEVARLNQITTDYCNAVGVGEENALELFLDLVHNAKTVVAHNSTFDQRIIRIAMKRYSYSDAALIEWAEKERHFCTMQASKHEVRALNVKGNLKNPSLEEAYKHYTGKTLENAHTAIADTRACMEVYWAMQTQKQQQQAQEDEIVC